MSVTRINPPELLPPLMDVYAHAVVTEASRLAFIAGQVALNANGELVGEGDHAAQALQVFRNLQHALSGAGASPANVVRMSIYVVDHRPELVPAIFAAGRAVFGDQWPVTSSVLIGVQALGLPGWLVEVDAIAAL